MKGVVRVGGLVFLATMLVAAYNFFVLGPRTETEAHKAVCAGRTGRCAPGLVRMMRTPFWQDLRYRVGGREVDVRCARSLYLVGEFRCSVRDRR